MNPPTQPRPQPNRRFATLSAVALLGLMTVLMFTSVWDDAPTSDDNVALMAGYSYLVKQDYRLEPQNPPLIKTFAAVPLLFMNLNQPWDREAWGHGDPDTLGREFLYHSGNDPDAMLRAARAPMILFAVVFGWLLFWWTRKHYGDGAALLTLFLYCFSPTFLTHGRFVATDLGATAGFFVSIITLLRFLANPTGRNMLFAGLAMGFALLTKYSTVALLPLALFLCICWVIAHRPPSRRLLRWRGLKDGGFFISLRPPDRAALSAHFPLLGRTVGVIAIAYLVVHLVYVPHIWNYPPERQVFDAVAHRDLYGLGGTAKDIVIWASDKPLLRPWAAHFLGLLVALKASAWGQPVFFLGTVYPAGLRAYFPFVYLIKEPLTLHLLTLAALVFTLTIAFRLVHETSRRRWFGAVRRWVAEHFTEFAFLAVIAVYWIALIRSNMNIGVRHLLPAFPFTFILVASQIMRLRNSVNPRAAARKGMTVVLAALLVWQAVGVLRVHPSYLAYFNELAGGPSGGWRYVNDSNLDWGQDMKRLAQFVDEGGIPGIHVDYFGPADAVFYLREKYLGPVGCEELPKGWVAISAMVYPGAPWNPGCDFREKLPIETAVARIGHSIFLFHVN